MSGPDLSVIVVTYRNAATITACLDAIRAASTRLDVDVIVVDNNSPDDTVSVVRSAHPDVAVIPRRVNDGFARGCRAGVEAAKGERLLFCNPDVVVAPDSLHALLATADSQPGAGIVGGRQVDGSGMTDPRSWWGRPTLWSCLMFGIGLSSRFPGHRLLDPESPLGWDGRSRAVPIVSGGFMLVERAVWESLDGFDPLFLLYGEDADLCLRARRAGWTPWVSGEARFQHAVGTSTGADASVEGAGRRLRLVLQGKATVVRRHVRPASVATGCLALGTALRARWAPDVAPAVGPRSGTPRGAWREAWRHRSTWIRGWRAGDSLEKLPIAGAREGSWIAPQIGQHPYGRSPR